MSLDKATAVLHEEAGKTLDPNLVKKFLYDVVPKIKHLFPELSEEVASDEAPASIDELHPLST